MHAPDRLPESNHEGEVLVVQYNVVSKMARWIQALFLGLPGAFLIAGFLPSCLMALTRGAFAESLGFFCSMVFIGLPFIIGAVCIWRMQPYEIRCDSAGISVRSMFDSYMLGQTERLWSDIHSVELAYDLQKAVFLDSWNLWTCWSVSQLQNVFIIEFKSGGKAIVPMRMLKKAQAGEWLSFMRRRLHSGCFSEDVLKLHRQCFEGAGDVGALPWQDDLSSRHVGTNYGPLPRDYQLQSGRYRVVTQLQSGGMSSVYLVLKADDGCRAVLKEAVLPHSTTDDHKLKFRELFQREALLLSSIRHEQIVVVLDSFSENDRDYMVLQYVPGPTLRDVVLKTGKLSESRVIGLASQLLDILKYLHGLDPPVIHRDVTPENLILRQDGKVVLVDFGAANQFLGTATGTFIGKQCYMAPEQLRGKASPSSDLYAFGATVYYLLTGSDPIPLSQSVLELSGASSEMRLLSEIIAQCTNMDDAARPRLEHVASKLDLAAKTGAAV